jgi:putative salt-induced outer membrane protein YdiY
MKSGLIFCIFAVSAFGDQIVMKNGDKITGSIVKKDGDNLVIKTEQFGTVTASWAKVDSIQSDTAETVVVQGKTVQGTVNEADGKVAIVANGATTTAAPADITAIRNADEEKAYERMQNPAWSQLWAGNASLGFSGSAGNAETSTFTTAITAARVTRTDKTSLYFNDIKASATAVGVRSETAAAIRGGFAYDHNVGPRVFFGFSNDWESDKFQALDLRYVIGGGGGYHVTKGKRSALDFLLGADFNHAQFSTPATNKTGEYSVGNTYTFKLSNSTSLSQDLHFFNDFSNSSNFRGSFDIGATTKIAKWLTWNLSFSDRYLNLAAPGRKTNDILYTTGLGVVFAH